MHHNEIKTKSKQTLTNRLESIEMSREKLYPMILYINLGWVSAQHFQVCAVPSTFRIQSTHRYFDCYRKALFLKYEFENTFSLTKLAGKTQLVPHAVTNNGVDLRLLGPEIGGALLLR